MTPGTYLRKRREAAQLTIEDAAEKLASSPRAGGMTFSTRCEMLKRALLRVEGNVDVLSPDHAQLVRTAFPFDAQVYAALVAGTKPAPRICSGCACTHLDPCVDGHQSCAWSEKNPDLCTTCEFIMDALTPGFIPINLAAIFAKVPGL